MRTVPYEIHKTGGRIERGRDREIDATISIGRGVPGDAYRRRSATVCFVDRTRTRMHFPRQCASGAGPDTREALANAFEAIADRVRNPDRR